MPKVVPPKGKVKQSESENILNIAYNIDFFFKRIIFGWLKYVLLLAPSTAVQCLASMPVLLPVSPNWEPVDANLLQVIH